MTDRMAAIAIGILCVTLINDVFGSPPVWSGLDRRINDIWRDVRSYTRDVLSGKEEDPERAGALLAQIAGLRDQVDIVAHDMADGRQRAAGARSAMLALVEIVQRLRLLRLLAHGDPLAVTIKDQCLAALDDHHAEAFAFLTKLREIELSARILLQERFGRFNRLSASWNRKACSTTDCHPCAKGSSRRATYACRIAGNSPLLW